MPNLRMDEHSAQSIIEFLEEETERQHPVAASLASSTEAAEHHQAIAVPGKVLDKTRAQ
jgi:hypothetical protein